MTAANAHVLWRPRESGSPRRSPPARRGLFRRSARVASVTTTRGWSVRPISVAASAHSNIGLAQDLARLWVNRVEPPADRAVKYIIGTPSSLGFRLSE